jgi:hypothetical protein
VETSVCDSKADKKKNHTILGAVRDRGPADRLFSGIIHGLAHENKKIPAFCQSEEINFSFRVATGRDNFQQLVTLDNQAAQFFTAQFTSVRGPGANPVETSPPIGVGGPEKIAVAHKPEKQGPRQNKFLHVSAYYRLSAGWQR